MLSVKLDACKLFTTENRINLTESMDLFADSIPAKQEIFPDVWLLSAFALPNQGVILQDLERVIAQAPLRHMTTKMRFPLSVAMSNCGELGWVSDDQGYRYTTHDPLMGRLWPAMPSSFFELANQAASAAGFEDFLPDACLVNQYKVGAGMGLHQDKNERDFKQPIVSVSLGIPAVFQFGGPSRNDKPIKIPLMHGDVVVWGGASRLNFHGLMPLKADTHSVLGAYRYNLTLRRAA